MLVNKDSFSVGPGLSESGAIYSAVFRDCRGRLFRSADGVENLVQTLLEVFVSIEMTGQNVEFEQKFNYRRPMYLILDHIWDIDIHRQAFQVCAF